MKINKVYIPEEIREKTKLKLMRGMKENSKGCWIMNKYIHESPGGSPPYGKLCLQHKGKKYDFYAHRLAYYLFKGEVPQGVLVLHKCPGGGNSLCINPDHLKLGDHSENYKDCQNAGRENRPKGSKHPKAKLCEGDIRKIFVLDFMGFTQTQIGRLFDVPHTAIGRVLRNEGWRHVGMITESYNECYDECYDEWQEESEDNTFDICQWPRGEKILEEMSGIDEELLGPVDEKKEE